MTKKMRFSMIMAITALLCIIAAVFVSPEQVQAAAKTKISKCSIIVEDAVYEGKAVTPKVTVKYKKKTLKKGKDYKLTLKNNNEIGQATCTIKGIGKYKGKVNKKFNITLDTVKGISIDCNTYESTPGHMIQDKVLIIDDVEGATGYIVYHGDTKDSDFMEVRRITADRPYFYFEYTAGSYVKIKPFYLKGNKVYYGELSEAFELDYEPFHQEMTEYTVTNTKFKQPTKMELVYDTYIDYSGVEVGPELCLKITNGSEIDINYWDIQIYDENGVDIGIYTSYGGTTAAPGEAQYIPLSNLIEFASFRCKSIRKIRLIPWEMGPDGWTASPWFQEPVDETYGEQVIFECEITPILTNAGKAEIITKEVTNEYGYTYYETELFDVPEKYSWLRFDAYYGFNEYIDDVIGGYGSSLVWNEDHYVGYPSFIDSTIEENLEKSTLTLAGGVSVELESPTKATVHVDFYDVTLGK